MIRIVNIVLCLLLSLSTVSGFVAPKPLMNSPVTVLGMQGGDDEKQGGIFGAIGDFFEELDAFVDDATSRRLGAGAAFYGKRKSSFYGKQDKNRKQSKGVPDPTEDYQGPAQSGYFKWVQGDDGRLTPVTRMKETNIERNPNFWDRAFKSDK